MRLGILSDTHDELTRTRIAVHLLRDAGAEELVHCGDLASPAIVEALAVLPAWIVFGNHDADMVPALQRAAAEFGPVCLGWGGVVDLGGKRVGVAHGHMTTDVRRVLAEQPEFLLSGHSHFRGMSWSAACGGSNPARYTGPTSSLSRCWNWRPGNCSC